MEGDELWPGLGSKMIECTGPTLGSLRGEDYKVQPTLESNDLHFSSTETSKSSFKSDKAFEIG
jgi:hypothetical protein